MTVKKQLRATYGLDSAGEKVLNVGYPQDLTDGVNIQYFIDENTVQNYDPTRGYEEHFVVMYNRKLFTAARKINKPAGNFNKDDWNDVRTDIQWKVFNHQSDFEYVAKPGEQLLVDARYNSRSIILPLNPDPGDTVWVKDEYNALQYNKINVQTRNFQLSTGGTLFTLSVPGETAIFVWDNSQKWWKVFRLFSEQSQNNLYSTVRSASGDIPQVGVNQTVFVNSLEKNHEVKFPVHANDKETLTIIDLKENLGSNPIKLNCFNQDYKINNKVGHYFLDKPGKTIFIYNATNKNWEPIFEVNQSWKKITSNYKTKAFEKLHLQPQQNITITLPDNASIGDEIVLANVHGFPYQVTITTKTEHKIVGDINQQYNRKYNQLTKGKPTEVNSFVLPNNGQGLYVQFTYLEENKWWVSNFQTRVEHVDENNRSRPGISYLATQDEVNKNHEDNPSDDSIVTPKTLANKTSTETRRGISRIATVQEQNLPTSGNHLDDVIITPKKLNSRQATEEIRGVAEVTTTTEVRDNNNDTHIITPKKLNQRRATEQLAGVAPLVSTNNPTAAQSRLVEGTGVYKNLTDNSNIITPKSLSQAQATENSKGVAYIQTQQEANDTAQNASDDVIITPKKLANRTALETRTGVSRMVQMTSNEHKQNIQNSLHSEVFITPKALASREASESLTGIAAIAQNTDVNNGTLDTKILTPLKFKTWLLKDHFVQDTNTGIEHSGNIWNNVRLTIRQATETQVGTLRTATQEEANKQGSDQQDILYITPKKLDGRRATQQLYGIAKIATNNEIDVAQANNEIFVTPAGLSRWTRTSQNAQFNDTTRGVGRSSTLSETWVGQRVSGQTNNYQTYLDTLVVTPRKLNYALQNYLPIEGKAVDQDKLDNLDSTQFLRSDVNTTNTAQLRVNKQTKVGALQLLPINTSGTNLTKESLRDKTGSLLYQDNTNFVLDNNLRNAEQFIFETNGNKTAELKKTGEFISNIGTFTTQNIGNLNVSQQMTYKGTSFDDYFVKSAGHTMTGDLSIDKVNSNLELGSVQANQTSKITLNGRSGTTTNKFQIQNNNQGLLFQKESTNVLLLDNNKTQTFYGPIKQNNIEVVDNSGKINYSLLKNVPTATISREGIVRLQNALDERSETLAPSMKLFSDLKAIVDNKADVVGQTYNNMKIREYLQIGNIRLVPDYENKRINFVWVDTPEEQIP